MRARRLPRGNDAFHLLSVVFRAIPDPFPIPGFLPYRLSTVFNLGKDALRESENALVKGSVNTVTITFAC